MESQRKNRAIYIDQEAHSTLSMAKEGILSPVEGLMNEKEAQSVDKKGEFKGKTFPFSFILAPSGKRNEHILTSTKKGETLDLIVEGKKRGYIIVDEVFKIDRVKRVKKIFATSDPTHPGVSSTLDRLGSYAVSGKYEIDSLGIKEAKQSIKEAKQNISASSVTGIILAAKPLHRAHERLIRLTLEKTDLLVLFLLKPYKQDIFSYSLRYKTLRYLVDNYLPKNRVVIVPFENTYIFAGYNGVILDSIAAKNFGCNKFVIGQNHSGIGMYYDKNRMKSILDAYKNINIDIEIVSEFVYCDQCKTLVSTNTCPHGQHHHISYHSESILQLLQVGLLPPAVLVRKGISAILLSELFPNRFKNIARIYDDIIPTTGLLEVHDEREFYIQLMKLYQTTSLT